MESSGSGPSPECGAGSIVWVRRRNGSWWPGKILGPEELPASHLTSPRTGTPVKLLGREDASVDWYNLEKSKRVKAFRCGEFDDCIERAESSQGMPPKKREKYARREDAILHALELEKELLRKQGKLDITPDNASGKSPNAMKFDAGDSDISNGKPGNSKPNQFLKRQQDTSKKSEIIGSPLHCEKERGGNQPTSENDHAEFMPRMKGLQDLGLKSSSAKEKIVFSGALDGSSKPVAGGTQDTSNRGPTMGRTSDVKGEEQIGGIFRAKRSRCMLLPSEPSDCLDYKEIYPNQIEISASRFRESDSYPFARHLIEDNSSEFMEDVESGSSESTSSELGSESDSSQTEPDINEEMASLSGAAVATEFKLDAMRRADALEECGSMSTDESDESSLSGDISHLYPHDRHSVNEAVSKWRLKGKRNMRNLVKRSIDADSRGFSGSTFRRRSSGQSCYRNDCFYDDVDGTGFTAKDSRIDMGGFDNGEYSQNLRASKDRSGLSHNMIDWEHMTFENRAALKRQDDKARHFDPIFVGRQYFGGRTRSMLMDVDLKVQASYQKGPVPIVSLMSKLDGKAIIGHPIQIEALEDGSSETLLPTNGYFGNGLINHEGNTSLPSAWRTAKRTNFRVPRPHLSSTLGGDEGVEDHSFSHQERQPSLNKYNVGSFEHKTGLVRKNASHIPRSPFDRKFQRKMPKRVSLSSNQKTRTLSSIGIEQIPSTRSIQDRSSCQMDGLIKPEPFRPTTVACIPVKLVFSRLLEKINRPPSKAVSRMNVPTGML